MGNGGTTVNYPGPSAEEKAYYKILTDQTNYAIEEKKTASKADTARKEAAARAGQANWSSYLKNLQSGYSQGLYGIKDIEDAASKFEKDYGLDIGYTAGEVSKLRAQYTKDIDKKRDVKINSAFKDLLGRDATSQEIQRYQQEFDAGDYTSSDLLNSIKSSSDYTSQLSDSYLEAYHDELYGKKITKQEGGKPVKTDQRAFTFLQGFEPSYAGDLKADTGLAFGAAPTTVTGTIGQIEEAIQSSRQKRQFMYDSGLTKLQGQIDKDVQKIKNEGGKEVAKIQAKSSLYGQLLGGFTF